jgi:hypothetical protein
MVVESSCTDTASLWPAIVPATAFVSYSARGPHGLLAVEATQIPSEALARQPDLAASANGWVRFACGPAPKVIGQASAGDPTRLNVHQVGAMGCSVDSDYGIDAGATFQTLTGLLGVLIVLILVSEGRKVIVRGLVTLIESIGPEHFFARVGGASLLVSAETADRASVIVVRASPSQAQLSRPNAFLSLILEASGPLFFLDFTVDTPLRCAVSLRHGAVSALFHYVYIALPGVPLIWFASLYDCERSDLWDADGETECAERIVNTAILFAVGAQQLLAFLYAAVYYFDLISHGGSQVASSSWCSTQ